MFRGEAFPFLTKLEVATTYIIERDETGGCPYIEGLQRRFCVIRGFIENIEKGLLEHGRILCPSDLQKKKGVLEAQGRDLWMRYIQQS